MDKSNTNIPKQNYMARANVLYGSTYKIKLDHKPNAIYITINRGNFVYPLFDWL